MPSEFFATLILTNVSFLNIEKCHEENEDFYKMSSKKTEPWHIYAGLFCSFIKSTAPLADIFAARGACVF